MRASLSSVDTGITEEEIPGEMSDWPTLTFNAPLPISSLEGKAEYFFSQLPLLLEWRGGTAQAGF